MNSMLPKLTREGGVSPLNLRLGLGTHEEREIFSTKKIQGES